MLGIVIINYLTYKDTIKCIESIMLEKLEWLKIYIVDNNSPNESYNILSEYYNEYENVYVIKSPNNNGYARGNNIGISKCIDDGCKFTIIANNDIIFTKDSINNMYEYIKNSNDIVIVGPRIVSEDYIVQSSITLNRTTYFEYLKINIFNYITQKKAKMLIINSSFPSKVYTVSGCCFIINNSLFSSMGAFDENTFLYNEENILGIQAEKCSYDTYYLPTATVIHAHGLTTGKQNMFVNREYLTSSMYYWRKYRNASKSLLIFTWLYFTLRWMIKTIYSKELRNGWMDYFERTISTLKKEISSR